MMNDFDSDNFQCLQKLEAILFRIQDFNPTRTHKYNMCNQKVTLPILISYLVQFEIVHNSKVKKKQ